MKKSILTLSACAILGLSLTACQTTKKAENYSELNIQTAWDGVKLCTGGRHVYYGSPVFEINGIPPETKLLEFNLNHVDANYFHTRATVQYKGGNKISADQFKYLGPCPRSTGIYEWKVRALNETEDLELASGRTVLNFPN